MQLFLQMETELSEFSRENKALELGMSHNKLRLSATTKEMMQEREQCHTLKVELRTIKAGLHNTSRYILEPKQLKAAIKELYKKHLQDFDQVRAVTIVCGRNYTPIIVTNGH